MASWGRRGKRSAGGVTEAKPRASACAQQGRAGDRQEPPLVPRSHCWRGSPPALGAKGAGGKTKRTLLRPGDAAPPGRASRHVWEHHPTRDGAPPARADSPRQGVHAATTREGRQRGVRHGPACGTAEPGQRFPQARAHRGRSGAEALRPCGVPVPQTRVASARAPWPSRWWPECVASPCRRRGWRHPRIGPGAAPSSCSWAGPYARATGAGGPRESRLAVRGGWGQSRHPRRRRAPRGPEARRAGPARRWAPKAWWRGPAGGGRGGQRGGGVQAHHGARTRPTRTCT